MPINVFLRRTWELCVVLLPSPTWVAATIAHIQNLEKPNAKAIPSEWKICRPSNFVHNEIIT